jgi:hypothetical protein
MRVPPPLRSCASCAEPLAALLPSRSRAARLRGVPRGPLIVPCAVRRAAGGAATERLAAGPAGRHRRRRVWRRRQARGAASRPGAAVRPTHLVQRATAGAARPGRAGGARRGRGVGACGHGAAGRARAGRPHGCGCAARRGRRRGHCLWQPACERSPAAVSQIHACIALGVGSSGACAPLLRRAADALGSIKATPPRLCAQRPCFRRAWRARCRRGRASPFSTTRS